MSSVIQKQALAILCGTIGVSLMMGCGSAKPPAPPASPAATPAASAPGGGHMPMMASAPGAHGGAPAGGHGAPAMPGAQPMAPTSGHASNGPTATAPASNDPAAMMAKTHGQAPTSGHASNSPTATSPTSNDPAAMMAKSHGQAPQGAHANAQPGFAPAAPTAPPGAAHHGQPAPGANPMPMPMPLSGAGHNQPGLNPGNATVAGAPAAGAPGAGGAHAGGNPAAMATPPGAQNPGAPGALGGAAGPGAAASQFPAGSAEAALAKFCVAMADSNLTEAGEYISPKAKGLLAQIRDGSISDEKVDSLKESFAPTGLTQVPARTTGTGKTINLSNAKSELLSFTLMKEDDSYLLREFKVSKLPTNTRAPGRSY